MKISVFGLGYVGCVTAACLAKLGHDVIGVEVSKEKTDIINLGKVPVKEKGLDEMIKEFVGKGKLKATTSTDFAIKNSDVSFICVGTPPKKDGSFDLKYLERACTEIAESIKNKECHIIVIRSTILPGTSKYLINLIEKKSGKKESRNFDFVVNPEFMREGSAIKDFFMPPFIIIGAKQKVGWLIRQLYKRINSKTFIVKIETAEMIKYANNAFHALKVAFSNEIGVICKKLGVESNKLMGLFCADNKLNLSDYYLMPGFAYGGSCLPKDISAIRKKAAELVIKTPLLDSIAKSNYMHIERAIKLIKEQKKRKIGILGIAFKPDTDDIRGNPILLVINKLLALNYDVKIFDPNVKKENLDAISKSYRKTVYDLISKRDLKYGVVDIKKHFSSAEEVLNCDVIIISRRDSSLENLAAKIKKDKILIDLQGVINPKNINAHYISLC